MQWSNGVPISDSTLVVVLSGLFKHIVNKEPCAALQRDGMTLKVQSHPIPLKCRTFWYSSFSASEVNFDQVSFAAPPSPYVSEDFGPFDHAGPLAHTWGPRESQ